MRTAGTMLALSMAAAPLAAQTGAPGAAPVKGQSLSAFATAAAGYDDNILASDVAPVSVDPSVQLGGAYGATDFGLDYSALGSAVSFGASAFSNLRFYDTSQQFTAHGYGGSAGVATSVTPRLHLGASFGASRSNQYAFWVFPGLTQLPLGQSARPLVPEYGLSAASVTGFQTGATISYNLTKRGALSFQYASSRATYEGDAFDLKRQSYSGRYTLGLTKYTSFRAGYNQERANYITSDAAVVRYGAADVGIDYGRPLSFSRRTKFTFGVNSLALGNGRDTYWTLGGHANLNHQFRVWNLDLAYNRGVGFIDGFADPFVADALAAGLTGQLSRRLSVSMSAGYSNGDVGLGPSTFRNFDSYTGSARTQFALLRGLSAFGEYVYYHYKFDSLIALPHGIPHGLNRQGVRAGLTLVVPIMNERKP